VIRPLTLDDLEPYLVHCAALSAESGRNGDPYYGPYGHDEPLDPDGFRERTRERWSKTLDTPGWRRAWGLFVGERLVGSGDVAGGDLPAGLHRVTLGIGIQRSHRGRGRGRSLLEEIVAWCRAEPRLEWLDLGVFDKNVAAQGLFRQAGFSVIGQTNDRWRVDGQRIDEIAMTLRVGPEAD